MNFYPFHIGDYTTHTAHLEPMEDLAFRRLIDLYYLREAALPADIQECARLIRMKGYTAEVEAVLKEFFVLSSEGWLNVRCAEEICKMKDKQTKAKASAQASVNARSTNAQRTLNERSTNAELPIPIPIPTPKKNTSAPPDGVAEKVWADFLRTRKTKVTETAMAGIRREAEKAGISLEAALQICCERGWQGFKADWLKNDQSKSGSFRERDAQQAAQRASELAPGIARRNNPFIPTEDVNVIAIASH